MLRHYGVCSELVTEEKVKKYEGTTHNYDIEETPIYDDFRFRL